VFDWGRDNYFKTIISLVKKVKKIGIEKDHLTMERYQNLKDSLGNPEIIDIAPSTMQQRMIKSEEEIVLIKSGAKIADIGGEALVKEIRVGASEIDIAMVGRDAMEKAIAKYHPNSELRDTWVWFQSGINTDGAHNPVTTRKLKPGDILSLNTFPMISGYYTALERTLFVGEVDDASMKAWEANVKVHRHGIKIIKPGVKCSEVTVELNNLFSELGYLHRRTFGYGHSFGLLSPYYGREGKLEFREDTETVLKPNMVVSMEPMILIPEGEPGAGGYREHDILVINEKESENITKFPIGPEYNIIK
jgi:creatinase